MLKMAQQRWTESWNVHFFFFLFRADIIKLLWLKKRRFACESKHLSCENFIKKEKENIPKIHCLIDNKENSTTSSYIYFIIHYWNLRHLFWRSKGEGRGAKSYCWWRIFGSMNTLGNRGEREKNAKPKFSTLDINNLYRTSRVSHKNEISISKISIS